MNRQDATSARKAGHALANNIVEEMAHATKELVAELTEKHAKQVEALIKSNNDAMGKPGATPSAATATTSSKAAAKRAAKTAAWKEKKEKATVCPQCDHKHPNRSHEQCWELPANAAKCPADWKLVKST